MASPDCSAPQELTRQQARREATIAEIKERAREQLATGGVGALTLRGVARDMGLSSAAIYRYFPAQADLITALCVDTYNDLADTVGQAHSDSSEPAGRIREVFVAFRRWALERPSDFALIFGTPFPGYVAPPDQTTEAAAKFAGVVFAAYAEAVDSGAVDLTAVETPDLQVPGDLAATLVRQARDHPAAVSAGAIYGWVCVLGFVTSELWGNLNRIVTDTDAMFQAHLRTVMRGMGLRSSQS